MPAKKPSLNQRYQQTIDAQRSNLMALQEKFNSLCDKAKTKAEEKIAKLQKDDKEGKKAVLTEQKKELDKALSWLKHEVKVSTRDTIKKLEAIQREREKIILEDLERQLKSL